MSCVLCISLPEEMASAQVSHEHATPGDAKGRSCWEQHGSCWDHRPSLSEYRDQAAWDNAALHSAGRQAPLDLPCWLCSMMCPSSSACRALHQGCWARMSEEVRKAPRTALGGAGGPRRGAGSTPGCGRPRLGPAARACEGALHKTVTRHLGLDRGAWLRCAMPHIRCS